MVDSATDSSITSVKTSYDDVNNALENLLGNMSSGSSYDAKSAIANLQNQINNFVGTNPVGTVLAFTTNTIPNGYLLCNGASFDTSKYSQLYSALGSASVPDMRGLFLRGLDTTGTIDNTTTRSLLSFEEGSYLVKDFNYGNPMGFYNWSDRSDTNPDSNKNLGWDVPSNQSLTLNTTWAGTNSTSTTSQTSGQWFGVTRPKNIAVNYIIKAVP